MVNGTTYAKKLRLNTRNGNRDIDIKNIYSLIASNRYSEQYNNTYIQQYSNMPIWQYGYKQRYRMPYSFRVVL